MHIVNSTVYIIIFWINWFGFFSILNLLPKIWYLFFLENAFESRTLELSHPGANGGININRYLYNRPKYINYKVLTGQSLTLN